LSSAATSSFVITNIERNVSDVTGKITVNQISNSSISVSRKDKAIEKKEEEGGRSDCSEVLTRPPVILASQPPTVEPAQQGGKFQKTKSQEWREFTQEFVAISTIDFDPMSFQDHQSPRNRNDTLRRRPPPAVETTVTSGQQTLPVLPIDPSLVSEKHHVDRLAGLPESAMAAGTSSATEATALLREKIVPSESFLSTLQQLSGSESSQDEPTPTRQEKEGCKTVANESTTTAYSTSRSSPSETVVNQSTVFSLDPPVVAREQQQSTVGQLRQDRPVQPQDRPVQQDLNGTGGKSLDEPARHELNRTVGKSTDGPVRQDLHTTAGTGTSSDLLEWAKTILAGYPGLKVCTGTYLFVYWMIAYFTHEILR
jgi:hypothetical protein